MPPPPGPGGRDGFRSRAVDTTRFLRGVQITNQQGIAEFSTIYPGWYAGRAIHIHVKVHVGGNETADTYAGGHIAHTGQLFFPEDLTQKIAQLDPYVQHLDTPQTTQEQDGIFRSQDGASSILKLEKASKVAASSGLLAAVAMAVDPQLTPRSVGGGGRGPGMRVRPPRD
jgi:hypothetical protein